MYAVHKSWPLRTHVAEQARRSGTFDWCATSTSVCWAQVCCPEVIHCRLAGLLHTSRVCNMVYLGYWFMFPVSILVATLAMTFGVGGAVLFSPIFIVVFPLLGVPTLSPATAFASSLLIMLVGFGSGLVGYQCRGRLAVRATVLG